MADSKQIIELYTDLAQNPQKDFGWDKGLENAKKHGYKQEWIDAINCKVWDFCAAVGNPFEEAVINKGDTVVDLGCGAGVDLLVSSLLVGKNGKAIGVDITPNMVSLAKQHAKEVGFENVKVLENNFEYLDLEDESVDVVISNGAINLTSCKQSVFAEINRILKPNGKLYFADMIDISIDEGSCCSVEQSSCCDSGEEDWANCVAGTLREDELIDIIKEAGFEQVKCIGHTHYTTAETTLGATFKAVKTPSDKLRKKHWEDIFKTADYTQVLWHQEIPKESLSYTKKYASLNASIIDVGCGASCLVDNLLLDGYKNITLLDTSSMSLDIVKKRVKKDTLECICEDVLNYKINKKFDLWHDRAVFHFLLKEKERKSYFENLQSHLKSNCVAVISTFAINSETKCAGLDIVQYDIKKMANELPANLKIIESKEYVHKTPKNSEQKYILFVIKKLN